MAAGESAVASDSFRAIDAHVHVFRSGLPLAQGRRYAPDYDADPQRLDAVLEAHGVAGAVLVQPSFLGVDNRFLVACLARDPRRFRGLVVVDRDVSVEQLRLLVDAGVVGVRLNLIDAKPPDFRFAPWPRFFDALRASSLHLDLHCEARWLPTLLPPALAAGVDVVVDHFGRPNARAGVSDPGFRHLLSSAASRQVWVKLSAPYRIATGRRGAAIANEATAALLDAFGSARLIWGSDWPHTRFEGRTTYDETVRQLHAWLPDAGHRENVLRRTPQALYGFPAEIEACAPIAEPLSVGRPLSN